MDRQQILEDAKSNYKAYTAAAKLADLEGNARIIDTWCGIEGNISSPQWEEPAASDMNGKADDELQEWAADNVTDAKKLAKSKLDTAKQLRKLAAMIVKQADALEA